MEIPVKMVVGSRSQTKWVQVYPFPICSLQSRSS